jgi:hypothetical protein
MLNSLAGTKNNFILIDTRGTLTRDASHPLGWANEIHPYEWLYCFGAKICSSVEEQVSGTNLNGIRVSRDSGQASGAPSAVPKEKRGRAPPVRFHLQGTSAYRPTAPTSSKQVIPRRKARPQLLDLKPAGCAPPHLVRLLRTRRGRPGYRESERSDKLPPLHFIPRAVAP